MKLLVLADDLTGALDTGVQFVAGHAATRVLLDPCYPLEKVDPSVQVLVDGEMRTSFGAVDISQPLSP